jgi:hypothetical protein
VCVSDIRWSPGKSLKKKKNERRNEEREGGSRRGDPLVCVSLCVYVCRLSAPKHRGMGKSTKAARLSLALPLFSPPPCLSTSCLTL